MFTRPSCIARVLLAHTATQRLIKGNLIIFFLNKAWKRGILHHVFPEISSSDSLST